MYSYEISLKFIIVTFKRLNSQLCSFIKIIIICPMLVMKNLFKY